MVTRHSLGNSRRNEILLSLLSVWVLVVVLLVARVALQVGGEGGGRGWEERVGEGNGSHTAVCVSLDCCGQVGCSNLYDRSSHDFTPDYKELRPQ